MNGLKKHRLQAGLSQQKAASILNIHRTTISKWEKGENTPHAALLLRVAALYNCSVDALLMRPKA